MIQFKNEEERLYREYFKISPYLRRVLSFAEIYLRETGDYSLVITCLFRTSAEQLALFESGKAPSKHSVHEHGRGADVRLVANHHTMSAMCDAINQKYLYDASRPHKKTAILEGDHVHLQTVI